MACVTNHLILIPENMGSSPGTVGLSNNSSSSSMNDSYHRIHGEVPTHQVVWRTCCDDSDKDFTDIIYEKAVGEEIAKVRFFLSYDKCLCVKLVDLQL